MMYLTVNYNLCYTLCQYWLSAAKITPSQLLIWSSLSDYYRSLHELFQIVKLFRWKTYYYTICCFSFYCLNMNNYLTLPNLDFVLSLIIPVEIRGRKNKGSSVFANLWKLPQMFLFIILNMFLMIAVKYWQFNIYLRQLWSKNNGWWCPCYNPVMFFEEILNKI